MGGCRAHRRVRACSAAVPAGQLEADRALLGRTSTAEPDHERLLLHQLNRGVFVRVLTVSDVIDLYRVRKLVECAAVRDIDSPPHSVQEQLVDTYARQTPDG